MNLVQRSVASFILVFALLDVVFMFPCCDEVLSPEFKPLGVFGVKLGTTLIGPCLRHLPLLRPDRAGKRVHASFFRLCADDRRRSTNYSNACPA